jgi:hypothetical protein
MALEGEVIVEADSVMDPRILRALGALRSPKG